MSTKYVPTISSGVAGPLGVLHLPRLWMKVSLEAAGKLADGYPGIGAGYDSMVVGVGRNVFDSCIRPIMPTRMTTALHTFYTRRWLSCRP